MKILLVITYLLPIVLASLHVHKSSSKHKCRKINGGWGEWSSFGPCSKTCGAGGIRKRHRYCDSPIPKYGGKPCVGDEIEVKPCDGYTECPINGGWGPWKKGKCSKKCNGGVMIYTRECNNPVPQHCGHPCYGTDIKKEKCNEQPCPPIDGGWTTWECGKCFKDNSGQCVQNCTRSCTNPKPQYGGADCIGESQKIETCDCRKCYPPKTTPTPTPTQPPEACYQCFVLAEKYAYENNKPNFVGHACRVHKSLCQGRENGIHDMYPAKFWFFLQCSPDGPWCKPCATRNLVYNPKCGACETTRDGKCTGSKPTGTLPIIDIDASKRDSGSQALDDLENDNW